MSKRNRDLRSLVRHIDDIKERGVVGEVAAAAIARALRDLQHAISVGDRKRIEKAIARLARALVKGL